MSRTNYAAISGIIMHSCAEHGTWADHDAAVQFVELMGSGDEARLRALAAQHKDQELQRRLQDLELAHQEQEQRLSGIARAASIYLVLDLFDIL